MITQTQSEPTFDLALNMARQSLYRFAALSLLDPRAGSWDQLGQLRDSTLLDKAAALIQSEPAVITDALGPGELPQSDLDPMRVLERLPASRGQFNNQYEQTFGLLVSNACPPYETEYINGKFTFQRSQTLADISGFYRAFGMRPAEQFPERHDHVVLELEFMALLLGLERAAAETNDEDHANRLEVCRDAQTRFLGEHLAWWLPAFATLLDRENKDGFYAAVGQYLAAFIPCERMLLGVEASRRVVTPSTVEPPDQCTGCLFNVES